MVYQPFLSAFTVRISIRKTAEGAAVCRAKVTQINKFRIRCGFRDMEAVLATTEIYDGLTDVLRGVFDDDELVARPEMTADDVDGWDSLSNIRFIMSVEKKFGVKFSAAEVGKLKNVGELASLVAGKKS